MQINVSKETSSVNVTQLLNKCWGSLLVFSKIFADCNHVTPFFYIKTKATVIVLRSVLLEPTRCFHSYFKMDIRNINKYNRNAFINPISF